LCAGLKSKDVATTFKQVVTKRENLETIGGMSAASSEGTTHSVRDLWDQKCVSATYFRGFKFRCEWKSNWPSPVGSTAIWEKMPT